jgi:hypothetical protein
MTFVGCWSLVSRKYEYIGGLAPRRVVVDVVGVEIGEEEAELSSSMLETAAAAAVEEEDEDL